MRFLRQFWPSLTLAVALHAALVVFLVVSLERSVPALPAEDRPEAIEATVVDEAAIEAQLERLREQDRARQAAVEAQQRAAAKATAERVAEEKRIQELQAQREAARTLQQQEAAERAARQEAEKRRLAELETQRKAEEARVAELEKQRQAAAERARQAEAERKRQEEAAKKAAAESAARQRALSEYVLAIKLHVQRHWNQPENWPAGTRCTVRVSQIPSGEVVQVRIVRSTGDPVLDRSVESAVLRASPLPLPSDPQVFEREIEFVFNPVN